MIVVLYDTATKAAQSIGSQVPDTVPAGMSVYTLEVEYSTLNALDWDTATATLIARGPSLVYVMTVAQFKRRIGMDRLVLLNYLELNPATDLMVRAKIKTLREWLESVQGSGVDVRDEVTEFGASEMADVFLSQNALPEGKPAFVAALLAPMAEAA